MFPREPNRPVSSRPPFWNASGLLKFYLESMFVIQHGSSSVGATRPAFFPTATLKRSWEEALDACTIEEAMKSYQIIVELLDLEMDRIAANNWPSGEKQCVFDCLHQQQTECLINIVRLQNAADRDDQVVFWHRVSDHIASLKPARRS